MAKKVLITGAAGRMASLLLPALLEKYELFGIDKRPVKGINALIADVRDLPAVEEAFKGQDVVVDFANDPDWRQSSPTSLENIGTTYAGLLAARRAGVTRYIYTSSNHITGNYEHEPPLSLVAKGEYTGLTPEALPRITSSMPVRPDSPFGIAKAASEAAVRYYAEQFGMSNICLRLGTSLEGDQPRTIRQYHSLITKRDLVHLYECAIEAPLSLRFGTFFGVSNNTWRIWDIDDTRELLGFTPQDDTESWRGKAFPPPRAV